MATHRKHYRPNSVATITPESCGEHYFVQEEGHEINFEAIIRKSEFEMIWEPIDDA